MAPTKKKIKRTLKRVGSDLDKKPVKNRKKAGDADESTSEPVISDKKIVDDENGGGVKESVSTPVVKKPCTWLKLDRVVPQSGTKPSVEKSNQGKEPESTSQIRTQKDQNNEPESTSQIRTQKDKNRKRGKKGEERHGNDHKFDEKRTHPRLERKGKEIANEMHEDRKDEVDEFGKNLGGLIFMCNTRTKPGCLRYQVMGVPANKKEVVMGITPGLKLFLYDYDLKLMYGIYKASSAGGMKLEPTAFGGGFPAQVRFTVHEDCLPLPESTFKKAMKDCYDERTHKFKTELTMKQVRQLSDLFHATPSLHPNGQYLVQERDPIMHRMPTATLLHEESIRGQRYLNNYGSSDAVKASPSHHENRISGHHAPSSAVPSRSPLFITEQEYRSYGLQQGRHLLPTTVGNDVGHTWEPNKFDQERELLSRNPASMGIDSAVQLREVNKHDPFFLSEEEYRTYGLRGASQMQNAASSMMTPTEIVEDSSKNAYDPYDDSTTALVNRYLALPRTTAMLAETHHLSGREHLINDLSHTSGRTIPNNERPFASYNLHEQSELNQRPYALYDSREPSRINPGVYPSHEIDMNSAPVSHRYSFAGPSLSLNR